MLCSANILNRVVLSSVLDEINKYRDAKREEESNETSEYRDIKKNINKFLIKNYEVKELHWMAKHRFEAIITMGVPDSSVGIANRYGLDGPGIESRWGQDFPQHFRRLLNSTLHSVRLLPGLSTADKAARA